MKAGTLRVISLLTLAAIWEFAGRTGNAHLLPPLSKVVTVWVELLVTGQLFRALAISLQALFIGFFISVLF
ncbi:MAG TPA: ABC transporter permease, partial [Verrucomicrobiae bacterium]|nr:ABC transporter permease [Verrucomicrobiae bacterium]